MVVELNHYWNESVPNTATVTNCNSVPENLVLLSQYYTRAISTVNRMVVQSMSWLLFCAAVVTQMTITTNEIWKKILSDDALNWIFTYIYIYIYIYRLEQNGWQLTDDMVNVTLSRYNWCILINPQLIIVPMGPDDNSQRPENLLLCPAIWYTTLECFLVTNNNTIRIKELRLGIRHRQYMASNGRLLEMSSIHQLLFQERSKGKGATILYQYIDARI